MSVQYGPIESNRNSQQIASVPSSYTVGQTVDKIIQLSVPGCCAMGVSNDLEVVRVVEPRA